MRTVHSACPLDCPDLCRLQVTLDDAGRIKEVDGTPTPEFTGGLICGKVRKIAAHVYSDERVTVPHVRKAGKGSPLEPVSWTKALDVVEARLRATIATTGADTILPFHYGGSNGWLTEGALATRFFRRLGAANLERTFCAAATTAATRGLYGKLPGTPLSEYAQSSLIIIWGQNPSATGIHALPYIEAARERGARLVVIDPRRTALAKKADLHIAPLPGTDLPLALSIANWLFLHGGHDAAFAARHVQGVEEFRARAALWPLARAAAFCDVAASDIETLATWYRDTSPAVIRCGWGTERNRHGGSAVAAILALPAIAGKFGVRGGGYTMSMGDVDWTLSADPAVAEPATPTRTFNMSCPSTLWSDARPVRAVFVYNCNPAVTAPNQRAVIDGFTRDDTFVVVHDAIWTDTARLADVVLPATTFLEHREIRRGYGNVVLYDAKPAIPPVGEARSNNQLFGDLLHRFGLVRPGDPMTDDELAGALYAASPHGASLARAASGDGAVPPGGAMPLPFVDVFPTTPSGKVELMPAALQAETHGSLYEFAPVASSTFPLTLISPALSSQITSTFGQLRKAPVTVQLSKEDAAAREIASGDRVRVYNELGEVIVRAEISDDMRAGVAGIPKGAWRRHTENGFTSNALIGEHVADVGGQAAFHDARVEVQKL